MLHLLPSSLLTVAIAATQGVYRSVKMRKVNAVRGEKSVRIASLDPIRTSSVLTTFSLAVNPVTSAVDTLQSPSPRGRNIGLIMEPNAARMLSWLSLTRFSRISKLWRNHIIIEAKNMIVNEPKS